MDFTGSLKQIALFQNRDEYYAINEKEY